MTEKTTIARHSLSEILAIRAREGDPLDPAAPEAEPEGPEFWKHAKLRLPQGKTSVHLRVDSDVVDWFRARGKGHLTRMNAVLRAYVEAQGS